MDVTTETNLDAIFGAEVDVIMLAAFMEVMDGLDELDLDVTT